MMVYTKSVSLGIGIGEEASLEHLVGREANSGHDGGRIEGCLFNFREVVVRIAVQFHNADVDQGIISVRPIPW